MKEEQTINRLPKDWKWVKLGEVAKVKGGKRLPKGELYAQGKTDYPYLRVVDFENMSINQTDLKYLNEQTHKQIKNHTITSDDLYISIAGTIGRVGTIPQTLSGANLTENAAKITEIKEFELKYLSLLLNSHVIQGQISEKTIATTQPKLALYRIEKLRLPLPPKETQQQIVSKIEELFSELDKGIEELKTAQQQLKVYRQAVLKWAFEGKLTNEGVKDGELPEGWTYKKISELADVVRGGSPRPAGDPKYYNGNIPFLKVADITKDESIYLHTFNYTIKEAGLHKTRKISPETLLLSNSGATLGVPKICMIDATMNDGIAAFLNLDRRSNLYLYYFWLSKTKELRNINMGAAQPNLNTDIIKGYEVPYCSFEEQQQIVQEIESRLSVCDKIEETITASLKQAESLRQSILKKAFDGKL
jgi:type I restriction enzyme, S subunit